MTEGNSMTKSERDSLAKLVRARAKVAKNEIESHAAWIMATVEAQLAARYPENHPAWAEVTEHANRAVAEANDHIAQRCRELGIPERFRPSIKYLCNSIPVFQLALSKSSLHLMAENICTGT